MSEPSYPETESGIPITPEFLKTLEQMGMEMLALYYREVWEIY